VRQYSEEEKKEKVIEQSNGNTDSEESSSEVIEMPAVVEHHRRFDSIPAQPQGKGTPVTNKGKSKRDLKEVRKQNIKKGRAKL